MHEPRFAAYFQILLFLAFIIPVIFFILTQQKTMELIRPKNRRIPTGQLWFQLIPLFGLIWQFFVILKISDSIRDELNTPLDDSLFSEISFQSHRPAFNAGILYATLFCLSCLSPLSLIKGIFALAGLCVWIFYWVQLSRYKKQIKERMLLISKQVWR